MSHDSHMTLKEQWDQAGNTVDLRKKLLVIQESKLRIKVLSCMGLC